MSDNTRIVRLIALGLLAVGLPASTPSLSAQTVIGRDQSYFQDVVSLSEVLGKAHAVRLVCNGVTDQYWRTYMQNLLDLEAPYQGGLRTSMVNAFNGGYSATENRFPSCTPKAVDAEKSFAEDGEQLAYRLAAANIPGNTEPTTQPEQGNRN
ncbi:MAG: TIGR02301 family protein [Pseudomonadota bacterium]